MTLLIMAICTVLFEKIYTILRRKEPTRQDITNFSFKIFKIMRSLKSSKCLKTVELRFNTQKSKRLYSLDCLFCFKLEIPFFLVNLVEKSKIISFKLKFCTQTNSNMHNSMVMFPFSVFAWKYLQGKFGSTNRNCQFELKFCTRLI